MSKTIFLDYASKRFEVTQEGYDKIREIISQYQLCTGCGNLRDNGEHLLVGKKCLSCVLHAHPSLTFVGFVRFNHDGYAVYSFTNSEGITFLSVENDSSSPQEDIAGSIEEYHFTLPTTYRPFKATEDLALSRSYWKVFGSLSQSVVILRYKDRHIHRGTLTVDFLAYKDGETVELSKRKTEHKNLLDRAKNLAEHTKKGGYYHLNGEKYYEIDETHLYPIIARLESASYNEQLAFLQSLAPEEPQLTLLETLSDEPQITLLDPDEITQEEPIDLAQKESEVETTESQPENTDVADPAQEIKTEQEVTTEKTKKRGKLHVVPQEPETNGEPTA